MRLENRTFIVSGGSSGLGLATAHLLLSHDANVSILDLNPPPSSTTVSTITDQSRTLFTKTDVSSTNSLSSAVSSTLKWIASTRKPLGGAICCAGIGYAEKALPRQPDDATHETIEAMSIEMFDKVLAVNLRGTVDLIRLTLPHLSLNEPEGLDDERGIIVVVSSVAAYEGQVGQLAYSASKGAVRSIVLPLAREVGQQAGIRIMGIAPGIFQTGMTNQPKPKPKSKGNKKAVAKKEGKSTGSRTVVNLEMMNYPLRMGKGEEFALLVKQIVENPMLNGEVIRLDGGVRLPSRL